MVNLAQRQIHTAHARWWALGSREISISHQESKGAAHSEKKRLQVHSEGMYCLTGTWALWDEQGPYARCSSSSSLPASRTNFKENVREGVQTPLVTSRQTGCLPRLSLESRPSSAAVVKLAGGKRGNKI